MAWDNLSEWLNRPLFKLEGFTLTLAFVVKLVLLPIAVFIVAKLVRQTVSRSLKRVQSIDEATKTLTSTLVYYIVLVLGVIWMFGQLGLSTSDLAVFTGGLGLGIGLGFQDAAKNFLSGLIMLFGRTVKPGDVITIEDSTGMVKSIGMYSCEIITVQDGTAILPNSAVLGSKIINWTHDGEERWIEVHVGVHYDSDLDLVRKLLADAAEGVDGLNPDVPPKIYLKTFGDNSMNFTVFIRSVEVMYPNRVISAYNMRVAQLFRENNVTIPYPQRDLYIHQVPSISVEK